MNNLITISILFTVIVMWTYYKRSDKLLYKDGTTGNLAVWNFRHISGIALLFIAPFILMPLGNSFLNTGQYNMITLFSLLITGCILLNMSIIPSINLPLPINIVHVKLTHYCIGILFRAIFLAAYEYFFRGVLLFTLISSTGVLPAVCIVTAFYSLLHIFSGSKEMLATIPFSFFLCWITFETRSILPAILLHWLIALPSEILVAKKITQSSINKQK